MPSAPRAQLKSLPSAIPWLLLSGILLLVLAAIFGIFEHLAHRGELHATGTVTEVEQRLSADSSIVYVTHIRFITPAGALVDFSPKTTSNQEFKAGDTVAVLYSPQHPQTAELGSALRVYPVAIAIGMVGIVLFDIGVAYWFFLRRGGTGRVAADIKNLRESVRRT